MDSLIKNLRRTLSCKLHLRRDVPIVVALSGGADSVALLSALVSEGYNCVAIVCATQQKRLRQERLQPPST